MYTQFIGYLDLAEGETFQGEIESYVQKPAPTMPKIGYPPRAAFTVKSIEPLASGFTETGLKVQLVDGKGRTHDLEINQPYVTDNCNFVLKNVGMVPLFVLKDMTGKEIDGAYVKLNVLKGQQDRFSLGGFEFRTKFYPDYILDEGKHTTRSMEFNNPTFLLSVERDGKKVAEGTVPRNGAMVFAGHRLEMQELRYWVRFSVIKELGVPIIYAGFAIASLAVAWRFLLYRREIVGAVREIEGEQRFVVAARSEFYKSLAEKEFTQLFDKLFHQRTGV